MTKPTPLTGNAAFSVQRCYVRTAKGDEFWFKLVAYPTGRASFPVESEAIPDPELANALCQTVNAGYKVPGLNFAAYADD